MCELCDTPGGEPVWQDERCRVVLVNEPGYPGFCRVILGQHVAEMTDLPAAKRDAVMAVVYAVEQALRDAMQPDKVNLASLGNMTPHLHWHVVPRFRDDRHFPGPIWALPQRDGAVPPQRIERAAVAAALIARLGP